MFNLNKISGSNFLQPIIQLDSLLEGSIHSILLTNSNNVNASVVFVVGAVTFDLQVKANSSEVSSFKVNIPQGAVVSVNAPTGVDVTVSYIEQPIDSSAALSTTQSLVAQAESYVVACENALPAGALDDQNVSSITAWSSSKIVEYTEGLQGNIDFGLVSAPVETTNDYGLITEGV